MVRLPLQIDVGQLRPDDAGLLKVSVGEVAEAHVAVEVGGQCAVHTVRGAQLQVGEPALGRLQEALFDGSPRSRYGPKATPAAVAVEARAAVRTEAAAQVVAVAVVVVQARDVGDHARARATSAHSFRLHAVADVVLLRRGEVAGLPEQVIAVLVVHLVTSQGVQVMILGHGHAIAQLVSPRHLPQLAVSLVHCAILVRPLRRARVAPVLAFSVDVIVAEGGSELQVLDELILGEKRVEDAHHVFALVVVGG